MYEHRVPEDEAQAWLDALIFTVKEAKAKISRSIFQEKYGHSAYSMMRAREAGQEVNGRTVQVCVCVYVCVCVRLCERVRMRCNVYMYRASGSVCASSVSFLRPRTTVTNSGPGLTGRLERPSGLKEGALNTKRASRRHKRLRHQTHRRRPTRLRRQTCLRHQISP